MKNTKGNLEMEKQFTQGGIQGGTRKYKKYSREPATTTTSTTTVYYYCCVW